MRQANGTRLSSVIIFTRSCTRASALSLSLPSFFFRRLANRTCVYFRFWRARQSGTVTAVLEKGEAALLNYRFRRGHGRRRERKRNEEKESERTATRFTANTSPPSITKRTAFFYSRLQFLRRGRRRRH